jgi:hypothetical protein
MVEPRKSAAILVVVLLFFSFGLTAADDAPAKKEAGPNLRDLSQEVTALQALYQLQLTKPQIVALRELAKDTADKSKPDGAGKASDKLRKALADFRDALVKASDAEKIADLAEALDDVQQAEKATLDDELDVTEEARAQAPRAFKILTPKQFAMFAGVIADGIGDPIGELEEAMEMARGLKDKEWKELRTQISDDIGRLLGGVDVEQGRAAPHYRPRPERRGIQKREAGAGKKGARPGRRRRPNRHRSQCHRIPPCRIALQPTLAAGDRGTLEVMA